MLTEIKFATSGLARSHGGGAYVCPCGCQPDPRARREATESKCPRLPWVLKRIGELIIDDKIDRRKRECRMSIPHHLPE
jgi:hypothetical protein